jgi:hypothetical protein
VAKTGAVAKTDAMEFRQSDVVPRLPDPPVQNRPTGS